MPRFVWMPIVVAAVLVGTASSSAAGASWARINQVRNGGPFNTPALLADGQSVVAAFNRLPPSSVNTLEVSQFTPSLIAGASAIHNAELVLEGVSTSLDDPQLFPGNPPQLFVPDPFAGLSLWSLATPTNPVKTSSFWVGYAGSITSAVLDNGTLFFVRGLSVYRGTSPPVATDMTATAPPAAAAEQQLGVDAQGHLWFAWYGSASNPANTGLWILQIDPTTGAPIGSAMQAPQSGTGLNGHLHFGFACAAICRLVYAQTAADHSTATGSIVSWAPGEATPTIVVALGPARITGAFAAAFAPNGGLWVAWLVNATGPAGYNYQATLGNARGGGGTIETLGTPPYSPKIFGDEPSQMITAVGYQSELVVAVTWSHAGSWDVYATTAPTPLSSVGIPNPGVIQDPVGRVVVPSKVSSLGRGRCVRVRVQAYKPATLSVTILTGKTGVRGTSVSKRASTVFGGPGIRTVCVTLAKKPRGYYTSKKPFHFLFGVHLPGRKIDTSHTRPVTIVVH
jgi:hypothetical protein